MEIFKSFGCSVYGRDTLTVEPGLNDSISFEITDSDGNQLGAVLLDKEHAERLAAHILNLVRDRYAPC